MSKPLFVESARLHALALAEEKKRKEEAELTRLFSFSETARSGKYGPYGYSGKSRLDKVTHDAIVQAHHLESQTFEFTQGGLNNGAVSTSAKTHDGLGVADTTRTQMTMKEAFRVVARGFECGVAGMIRGVAGHDNMVDHIHWVRINAKGVMHPSAYAQLYNSTYGVFHGGAGLAGAPGARWYGPEIKNVSTWQNSKHNPINGWRPDVS